MMLLKTGKQSNHRSYRAYTILEILMVVVVIAIMSVAGAKFLQSQSREAKIKVALSEINQYSQAGLSYFHLTNVWPTQTSDFNIYLPQLKNKKNPWGNDYKTNAVDPKQGSFEVFTVVPDKIIADRLVAALPAAKATAVAGGYQVSAYTGAAISVPTPKVVLQDIGHGNSPGGMLGAWPYPDGPVAKIFNLPIINVYETYTSVGPGSRDTKTEALSRAPIIIPKPTCDAGYTPAYKVMLSGYQKGCFLYASSTAWLSQCDTRCPTYNDYCGTFTILGVTMNRTATDECCDSGWMSLLGCSKHKSADVWSCTNFRSLQGLWIPPPLNLGSDIFGWVALPQIAANSVNSNTAFESAVEITQQNETPTAWTVLVHTTMNKPNLIVIGNGAVNDHYDGEVSYFTYCKSN